MQAFVAPLSWMTLTSEVENNMDSDDYDTLLLAVKPVLLSMKRMTFPKRVKGQKMKKMWVCKCVIIFFTIVHQSLCFYFNKLLFDTGWSCYRGCMIPCLRIKGFKWQNGQKNRSLRTISTVLWGHQEQVRNQIRHNFLLVIYFWYIHHCRGKKEAGKHKNVRSSSWQLAAEMGTLHYMEVLQGRVGHNEQKRHRLPHMQTMWAMVWLNSTWHKCCELPYILPLFVFNVRVHLKQIKM